MDYYQQGRPQGSAGQSTHQYVQYPAQTGGSSQMFYQQPIGHQAQQATYQQHYSIQPGSANTSIDYGAQHNQSTMSVHSQGSNQRRGPRSAAGDTSTAPIQTPQPVRLGHQQELPLRIVIDSKHVGAIIGTGGNNIREITKESKARVVVDVQRTVKDQQGHSEKIISILGGLDNCSKACVKILEVVQRENEKDESRESNEIELKIRAHNQLVGRLIGKHGATIKKIMQDTGTTIFVSNEQAMRTAELSSLVVHPFPDMMIQMERTITVKGPTIETASAAEHKISAKLRQSYETDLQNRMSMPGMPGLPIGIAPIGDAYAALASTMRPMGPILNNQQVKTTKMWVPNSMVGAIIGAKGSHIRNIMRNSGANIRIEGGDKKERNEDVEKKEKEEEPETFVSEQEEKGQGDGSKEGEKKTGEDDERLVTITGTDAQQYRAQFWIFQRVAEQSQHYIDEVKLRTELIVPSRLVGRIIGKGGQNVRELQRITGASVKIPEDEPKVVESRSLREEGKEDSSSPPNDGTVVRIVGNFSATQSVQCRIGQLINDYTRASLQEKKREDGQETAHKQSPPSHANGAD